MIRAFAGRRTIGRIVCRAAGVLTMSLGVCTSAAAEAPGDDGSGRSSRFGFAIVGSATDRDDRPTAALLRAIDAAPVRFVVHFEMSAPSDESCADAALERRRALLDASPKPVVPVTGASQWAACGHDPRDPVERLDRIGEALYGADRSLGQAALPWSRQSAIARFRRFRENLRWQQGRVLFATGNLPDNNNNYRLAAGRNGEFEERMDANRAWLARTFRLAAERRLAGVVLFVDASPRFATPLRAPDPRSRDRDGYYEWKVALRDAVAAFGGPVLLVQTRRVAGAGRPSGLIDHPLRDAAGRTLERFSRIAIGDRIEERPDERRWIRVDVDPSAPGVFTATVEQSFDDPTGELYGPSAPSPN